MAASSSNGNRRVVSIVEDQGVYSSSCGYCKSLRRSSVNHGLFAHRLTVEDYQELLDRGWRRSGMLLYKPDCSETCCPPYAIRLEAEKFVPSKEQKRVLRRMNRFLEGEDEPASRSSSLVATRKEVIVVEDDVSAGILSRLKDVIRAWLEESGLQDLQTPEIIVKKISEKLRKQLKDSGGDDGVAQYTSNAAFVIAAAVKRRQTPDHLQLSPVQLALLLALRLADQFAGGEVKACKGHMNFYVPSTAAIVQQKSCMEATMIDQAPASNSPGSDSQGSRKRKRSLEIWMKRSEFDREEFELYKRYQVAVHNDRPEDVRESSYRRFLVDTPLVPVQSGSVSYGSFHQQYRIDKRLVAVGVVDILPKCLSSKYLFWDPDFAFLSLGKFSVLQEIEWVQNAHQLSAALQYYYLGYYIHSCPKMRYKAAYVPSELLCPRNFRWRSLDDVRQLVESGNSVCLSEVGQGDEQASEALNTVGDVPIYLKSSRRCVLFRDFEVVACRAFGPQFIRDIKLRLLQYWQLLGSQLASRVAYGLQAH